jgi:hypothetical protein
MADLSGPVYDEVKAKIATALGYSDNSKIITDSRKLIRYDWRSLVAAFEKSGNGLNPPYVVIRPLPSEEANFGMAVHAFQIPIEIYYINSENNKALADITTPASYLNPATVSDTSNMFVGQTLWFLTSQITSKVTAINSPTSIRLDSSMPVSSTQKVVSEVVQDVGYRIGQIRTAFRPGGSFTNFQITEDPSEFISDLNPVNDYFEGNNYQMFGSSCCIKILVGEIL